MISVAQLFLGLSALSLTSPALARQDLRSRIPLQARQTNSGDVIIQMFEWNWDSLAQECTEFIGPAGYRYIQVSPPQEHISGSQWWTSYQAVSYTLTSKRGNRDQFKNMVSTCKAAGVDVIVDVILNHMAGIDSGTGVAGASFTHYSYPPTYSTDDFHYCGTPGNDIQDWTNGTQVQNCELVRVVLFCLKTESDYVRGKLAGHLSDLLSLGVTGFRLDAAKHVPIADLQNILSRAPGAQFITQEVYYGSGDIQPSQYQVIGDVTEFTFEQVVKDAFLGNNGNSISQLSSVGDSRFISGDKANIFVVTHDTERSGEGLTSSSPSNTYTLAHIFMLAFNYGNPMVLSSYTYSSTDDGAPNNGQGTCSGNGGANGYLCQHRWVAVAGMVPWRNSAGSEAVSNWVSPQGNRIAFGRGAKAYVAINNADDDWSSTFSTGLPDGVYCNVISSTDCQEK
ncbi:glycoside hydrolase family 13 protein [Collybiopsis luxurians FD-317 M1]|uniref:Alpha-amylase n=1 Tax=Collybiopsis luxurians FD-317 M1 TaxID=944289 RepID=A0A0D0AMC3_9AGAR|nr:glycoside hydrolase family 13 protein [Collybiopsis luxurians FD-317 M1]